MVRFTFVIIIALLALIPTRAEDAGIIKGRVKALNTQMNKGNITNIISSDQVGRFPDAFRIS